MSKPKKIYVRVSFKESEQVQLAAFEAGFFWRSGGKNPLSGAGEFLVFFEDDPMISHSEYEWIEMTPTEFLVYLKHISWLPETDFPPVAPNVTDLLKGISISSYQPPELTFKPPKEFVETMNILRQGNGPLDYGSKEEK